MVLERDLDVEVNAEKGPYLDVVVVSGVNMQIDAYLDVEVVGGQDELKQGPLLHLDSSIMSSHIHFSFSHF